MKPRHNLSFCLTNGSIVLPDLGHMPRDPCPRLGLLGLHALEAGRERLVYKERRYSCSSAPRNLERMSHMSPWKHLTPWEISPPLKCISSLCNALSGCQHDIHRSLPKERRRVVSTLRSWLWGLSKNQRQFVAVSIVYGQTISALLSSQALEISKREGVFKQHPLLHL